MVCSLRFALKNIIGKKKCYSHYYNRMINDFVKDFCDFDIRQFIKVGLTTIPCHEHVCKRGFCKRVCKIVIDVDSFNEKVKNYYEKVILPLQELRHHRSIARQAFIR